MIVFFGKNGSNVLNLLYLGFPIKAAFTNRKDSDLLKILNELKIPTYINSKNIKKDLEKIDHKLIVLLGYMKILDKEITDNFNIINIHPSILPNYKGLNAFERSFYSKKHTGITYHYINENLDSGEIIEKIKLDYSGLNLSQAKLYLKYNEYMHTPKIILQEYAKC